MIDIKELIGKKCHMLLVDDSSVVNVEKILIKQSKNGLQVHISQDGDQFQEVIVDGEEKIILEVRE